jgi:hypothetical protein
MRLASKTGRISVKNCLINLSNVTVGEQPSGRQASDEANRSNDLGKKAFHPENGKIFTIGLNLLLAVC